MSSYQRENGKDSGAYYRDHLRWVTWVIFLGTAAKLIGGQKKQNVSFGEGGQRAISFLLKKIADAINIFFKFFYKGVNDPLNPKMLKSGPKCPKLIPEIIKLL
jgi:hypothetical protein